MRILVYGLGRSGMAAARSAIRHGHTVSFIEARRDGADIDELLRLGCERHDLPLPESVDLCIAAPGVPIDHPDLDLLRNHAVEVIGEVEWTYRNVEGEYIGVTGTAGKGTVTRWLSDTLAGAGLPAIAGGNIDPALSEVAQPGGVHVVELSSFQLERCPTLKPRIAIVLNLGSDHLDRHRDISTYHAAKKNLLANLDENDFFIYNADDPTLEAWAKGSRARNAGFSLVGKAAAWLADDGRLMLADKALLHRNELRVVGRHHIANGLAVALAACEMGLEMDEIGRGLRTFEGLPGRYSQVGRVGNITFIEDSIATRPLAVRAALEATPAPVVWIAGGQDKGADVNELEDLIRSKVRLFIGIGQSGPALEGAIREWVPTHLCGESDGRAAMKSAVTAATAHLRAHSKVGGTVLLAPLASSFDQFRDYRDRADAFREAVGQQEVAWTLSS